MGSTLLLYRLILRPMLRERGRSLLILVAVALGVSVVLAIDLASGAAAGSFRSSMETLSGDNDLEVTATGGVPEYLLGKLVTLPYNIRVNGRIEDHATLSETGKTVPLIGIDLIAEASNHAQGQVAQETDAGGLQHFDDTDLVWGHARTPQECQRSHLASGERHE